ncbi:MAG: polysaccharide deacetylase family protein [Thermoleophilia bacterium]
MPPAAPPSRRPPLWGWLLAGLAALAVAAALIVRATGDGGSPGPAGALTATAPATAPVAPSPPPVSAERRAMAELSLRGTPIYRGSERRKLVALTFDDGPGRETTDVIGQLARLRVPATFFVIGRQIAGRESELRAMVAHGHEVGVHTWSHPDLTTLKRPRVRSEVLGTRNLIRRVTGVDPGLLRPPYGAVDRAVLDDIASERMVAALWDVDALDWHADAGPGKIAATVLREVRPGSIILMHDGPVGRPGATVRALPRIVRGLRARGLEPVTVSELLRRDPPPEQPPPARATTTAPSDEGPAAPAHDGSSGSVQKR